ncbi:hypothetical protein Esti_002878 [Eimeria stiedai]
MCLQTAANLLDVAEGCTSSSSSSNSSGSSSLLLDLSLRMRSTLATRNKPTKCAILEEAGRRSAAGAAAAECLLWRRPDNSSSRTRSERARQGESLLEAFYEKQISEALSWALSLCVALCLADTACLRPVSPLLPILAAAAAAQAAAAQRPFRLALRASTTKPIECVELGVTASLSLWQQQLLQQQQQQPQQQVSPVSSLFLCCLVVNADLIQVLLPSLDKL